MESILLRRSELKKLPQAGFDLSFISVINRFVRDIQ